ncbi:MAG: PEGA domain-containing protein [Methanospirillum sp.]|uniref:PEGA domain-containing protein n=1 Tax=Methanospirillum sp. TaxID=45200 RepID=UPI0023703102|nr:PEGA domain-containing protein [Methanospirillum sp.]MDD1729263.1 PEGA domain-containing protein [Methanospirillum sp.]
MFFIIVLVLPVLFFSGIPASAEYETIDLATVGYLQIQTPVEGARVYLDQVFMGFIQNGSIVIPIDVMATPRYSNFIIEYSGYHTYVGPLPALIPGKTVSVSAELNKTGYEGMGIISFECGVPGAGLYLNGEKKGETPDSGNLFIQTVPSGLYQFTVKRAGNLSITQQQYVSSNAVTVYRVKLEPALSGDLVINSTPEGSGIFINNRYLGVSPLTIPDVPVGNQTIRITREGYQEWTNEIIVVGGETDQVDAVLVSLPPTVVTICPEETTPAISSNPLENTAALYGICTILIVLVILCGLLGVWVFRKQKE